VNRNALYISAFLSLILTIILWNTCPFFVKSVDKLLLRFYASIQSWILYHGVFALSLGLIPFCSYLIWKYGSYSSILILIVHSIFAYSISLSLSWYCFLLLVDVDLFSSVLPKALPHEQPWRVYEMNLIIPLSSLIPMLVLLIIARFNRKKSIPKTELDQ
jgi:hypothetical protein